LRVTSGGNLLPNYFMLVPAQVDLPILSGLYPTGTHPFEPTKHLKLYGLDGRGNLPRERHQGEVGRNDVSAALGDHRPGLG